MQRDNTWIVLARVVDIGRISKRSLRVEEVVGASGERDPFPICREGSEMSRERTINLLVRSRGSRLPLVESLPSRLNGADDTLFKVSAVLLHHDNGLLKKILLEDLFLKLMSDGLVGDVPGEGVRVERRTGE